MYSMISLPELIKIPLRKLRDNLKVLYYYGDNVYCPVCKKRSRQFLPFGLAVKRDNAECVHCHSLERHRLLWLYLAQKTDLFDGKIKSMLHVAPEPIFEKLFSRKIGEGYLTADLNNPKAIVKMDITDIPYSGQTFDVIYCSHVLEHVVDDRRAMREFFRVLKDEGWAILLVPIGREKTYEDSSIVDPRERLRHFGQDDHVRIYGYDYVDRLREAGFDVKVTQVNDLVNENEAKRMGLTSASGEIYYCTKPTGNRL